MKIVKEAYPDHTQFEKSNPHYDPSSKEDDPKWSMVDVQFVRMMKRFIPLEELKTYHQAHKATGGPLKKHDSLHPPETFRSASDSRRV